MTTAPRKRAPAKRAPAKTRQEKVAAFDEFRRRAAAMGISGSATRSEPEPVVLGKEHGFDPPIVARLPQTLTAQTMLDIASDSGNSRAVLRILIGNEQMLRVAQMFEAFDDRDALLSGLVIHIWERFLGPGAGEVSGGTPAS